MRNHVMWTDDCCNLRVSSFKTKTQRAKFIAKLSEMKMECEDIYVDMIFEGEISAIDPSILRGIPDESSAGANE